MLQSASKHIASVWLSLNVCIFLQFVSAPAVRSGAAINNKSLMCRWNFTPSPGWTKEEAAILKLCLMKYGIGRWVQILDTGLLPGKLIQQLNGQTQRLLGQQSLAGIKIVNTVLLTCQGLLRSQITCSLVCDGQSADLNSVCLTRRSERVTEAFLTLYHSRSAQSWPSQPVAWLCAAVTGLHVDVDRIREDNSQRTDVERKGGLIIWSGRKCCNYRHNFSPSHHCCTCCCKTCLCFSW